MKKTLVLFVALILAIVLGIACAHAQTPTPTVTTTTPAPTVTTTISRFELYPAVNPTCYMVGFTVTVNGQSFYQYTQIPLASVTGQTQQQIAAMAYDQLKDGIAAQVATLSTQSPLVGSAFTPVSQ